MTLGKISDLLPATPREQGSPAQYGSQCLTYIVWVINALSLGTSTKFVIGCFCTLLLPSDAMLFHNFTVYQFRRDNCGCPGLMLVHLQPIPYAENLPFYQW